MRNKQGEFLRGDDHVKIKFIPKNSDFYLVHSRPPILEVILESMEYDLIALKNTSIYKKSHDNLTPLERKALSDLQHNLDLIVRKADKGGGL